MVEIVFTETTALDVPHKLLRRKYPSAHVHSPRTHRELGSVQTLPGVTQGALNWPRGTADIDTTTHRRNDSNQTGIQ